MSADELVTLFGCLFRLYGLQMVQENVFVFVLVTWRCGDYACLHLDPSS